ncbi:MAG: magnesium chelatase [Planctomycetota bacterium]
MKPPTIQTVGALRKKGCRSRSVKQELRENLIARLPSGEAIFPGIIGYDDTVIPQLCNAILSRHDILLLGLRGQAKTRILRMLPSLLDEWTPTPAGSDLPDDPLSPKLTPNRRLLEQYGDDLEIRWLHRDERFHEKLATPDVTIADLIGEIDLVKHAEGRHLTDEGVIHYGLIPRTNRGIFAINELPDLAPRIQVGLFNALEERDVQIRGFPVRLPLDVFMAFTANPEDYTNRGRIVTPLKDRIGSVIRTHYPLRTEHALAITKGSAWLDRNVDGWKVDIPPYMLEIIEEMGRIARQSPHINQQSGVSVRTSIAGAEILVSNAERRCLRHGEKLVVPRISDLSHIAAGCRGKIEMMLAEDERAEDKLIASITGEAVKAVFEKYGKLTDLEAVVQAFADKTLSLEIGDEVSTVDLVNAMHRIAGLRKAAAKLCAAVEQPFETAAYLAAAAELILEALYVNNRLSKYAYHGRTYFKR